jgi:hypothetical protein
MKEPEMLTRPAPQTNSTGQYPSFENAPGAATALSRIRREYDEMPGLCLTLRQAQRLFAMDASLCEPLLRSLVSSGYLRVTRLGYMRA